MVGELGKRKVYIYFFFKGNLQSFREEVYCIYELLKIDWEW